VALTLRERCNRRLVGLKANRQPYEAEWREIASLAQPARSRFLNSDTNKNARQRNRNLSSSHGIFAFRTLQGGMTSGLSSQSRPWFSLATYDDALMEDPEVTAWLAEVERRMYAFLAQTNFYGAAKTGYLEMGLFGTEGCVMQEDRKEGAVCHQLTAGEYWIGVGASLMPEALYRRCPLTVMQAVSMFGARVSPRIRNLYDTSSYDTITNIYHAIELNDERVPDAMDARGKAFRSFYWDEDDGRVDTHLSLSGYEEQPFWAPRWDTTGNDAWGVGPGADALPDLRELMLQTKRLGDTIDYVVWPEIVSPASIKLKRQPKAVTTASRADMEKVDIPYQIPVEAVNLISAVVQRSETKVNVASYADLFMAITNMQGIQPRNVEEIASRNEEKLTQLGPVIERVNNEKLEIVINRTFGVMQRARLLPPAPQALAESELKINFVSILTQMQRMVGLGSIERTAAFVGKLAAQFPSAADKLNVDDMIDEYADRAGAPPKIIVPTDMANEGRAAAAARAQAAEAVELAAKAAPAAKDALGAARLMSELPMNAAPQQQLLPPPL
jgi:hypothetical protein